MVANKKQDRTLRKIYGVCVRCGEKVKNRRLWHKFNPYRMVGECLPCHEGRYQEDLGDVD